MHTTHQLRWHLLASLCTDVFSDVGFWMGEEEPHFLDLHSRCQITGRDWARLGSE